MHLKRQLTLLLVLTIVITTGAYRWGSVNAKTSEQVVISPTKESLHRERRTHSPSQISLQDLLKQMKSGDPTQIEIALLHLKKLPLTEIPQALEWAKEIKDQKLRLQIMNSLVSHWASLDPLSATQFVLAGKDPNERIKLLESAFGSWADHAPSEALAFYQDLPDELKNYKNTAPSIIGAIFSKWLSSEPRVAFQAANELGKRDWNAVSSHLFAMAGDDELRATFLEMTAALEDKDNQQYLNMYGVRSWLIEGDLEEVVKWIDQQPIRSGLLQVHELSVLGRLIGDDPKSAVDWFLSRSDEKSYLGNLVHYWAMTEPVHCAEWLSQQELGPKTDQAVKSLANIIAEIDPESSLDWTKEIRDQKLRQKTAKILLKQWISRAPQAAESYLDSPSLADSERQALRQNLTSSD